MGGAATDRAWGAAARLWPSVMHFLGMLACLSPRSGWCGLCLSVCAVMTRELSGESLEWRLLPPCNLVRWHPYMGAGGRHGMYEHRRDEERGC